MMRHINHAVSKYSLFMLLSLTMLISFLVKIENVQTVSETVVRIVPQTSYADVGEEFTINVTVENVQNLYGIEITLRWNASVLRAVNVDVRLGVESNPDGVLHAEVYIVENEVTQAQGKYVLSATSVYPAPSFSGSGNIVKLTFNVDNYGNSQLNLETSLYDYPPPDRYPPISYPIEHTTINGFFEIIPEFPNVTVLLLFMVSTIAALAFSKRILRRFRSRSCDSCLSNKAY